MRTPSLPRLAILASLMLVTACGGEAPKPPAQPGTVAAPGEAMDAAQATVTILEPAEGAEVQGPSVLARMEASGVRIMPAGTLEPGTGHHHLYLDTDLGEPGVTVPKVPGHVIHLGTGDSEFTFDDVAPGEHRLIAVLADGVHVPLTPWVVDTIAFVVR